MCFHYLSTCHRKLHRAHSKLNYLFEKKIMFRNAVASYGVGKLLVKKYISCCHMGKRCGVTEHFCSCKVGQIFKFHSFQDHGSLVSEENNCKNCSILW